MRDAVESIQRLLTSIGPILKFAKIRKDQINVASGLNLKINEYADAFDWLHEFILSDEMIAFRKIFNWRSVRTWQFYLDNNIKGLDEQLKLEHVAAKLRRRWRQNRPRLFGPNHEQDTDQTNVT